MFDRQIEITKENSDILFVNAVIENLKYGIISLDTMFSHRMTELFCGDRHTFFFFYMQSVLTAQGNIWNILFNDYYKKRQISYERTWRLRKTFGIDVKEYPLVGNKEFRNTNEHFDERYEKYIDNAKGFGDLNIIDASTDEEVRNAILNTPHLRTIDIEQWTYISYNRQNKKIILDLQQLRHEMFLLLEKLCVNDIRRWEDNRISYEDYLWKMRKD